MSQQINLFNPVFLKQEKYFSSKTMLQAVGLIVLGVILIAGFANYQLYRLKAQAAGITSQLGTAQAQLAKVNAEMGAQQEDKVLLAEVRKTEEGLTSLKQAFDLLAKGEFGNDKGYSDYMRAFARQIVSGLWLTQFDIHGAGNELSIQGRVLQPELVPAYLKRLGHEPALHGKSFATLEMNLPKVETSGGEAAKSASRQPARFLEFSLQSAGIKDLAGASGAQNK